MVAPITGPFVITSGSRSGTSYKYISTYRQAKPFNLLLTPHHYRSNSYQLSDNKFVFYNPGQMSDWMYGWMTGNNRPQVDNAAYASFIGKMRAQNASLGVTLAEQSSARKMMIDRSKQLLGFSSSLVRRDFRSAYRWLRKDFPRKGIGAQPKSVANLYLEWSWGWSPMVSDIGEALKTLIDPVVPIYARASSRTTGEYHRPYFSNTNGYTPGSPGNPGYYWRTVAYEDWYFGYRCSMGAKIAVDNPNVALANRLGVLNIPQIIWQVQPFSFIVDKYANIGQMIGSLTDTYGFTLTDAWTTRRMDLRSKGLVVEYRAQDSPGAPTYIHKQYTADGTHVTKLRQSGLTGPTFTFRKPTIGSFGEAMSYMALLYQLLSPKV